MVEELDPIIEETVRMLGLPVIGKEAIPADGELDQDMVYEALAPYIDAPAPERRQPVFPPAQRLRPLPQAEDLPVRPPVLCPGCRHRSVFTALKRQKLAAMGDIGCYMLGADPPLNALDSSLCMGASIGMMAGFNEALGRKAAAAVIGDSTFFHSGITGLISASYNEAEGLVLILDNRTTAMTGHQGNPGTGVRPGHDRGAVHRPAGAVRRHRRALHDHRRQGLRGHRRRHQDRGGHAGPRRHRRGGAVRPARAREVGHGAGGRRALQPLRAVPGHRLSRPSSPRRTR